MAASWENSYRKGPFEGVGVTVFVIHVTACIKPVQSPVVGCS